MSDENTGLPLEALKGMQPSESPVTDESDTAAPAPIEKEATASTPMAARKTIKPVPQAQVPGAKPRYSKADTSKGARRLTYIVLVLLLFVLLFGGSNAYQSFINIPALKGKITEANDKIRAAGNKLSEITAEKAVIVSERDNLARTKLDLEAKLEASARNIAELKEEKETLTAKGIELDNNIARLTQEKLTVESELTKLDEEHKQLDTDFKAAVDKAHALEEAIKESDKRLIVAQKEYKDLKDSIRLQRMAENARKLEWESEYAEKYAPAAMKVIEHLNQLTNALKEGMNYRTYRDMVKELEAPYEEFKIPLNENLFRNPSFKLISSAYNTYRAVEERWRNIVRANPNEDKWRDKIFKMENPVVSHRPWADQIQELWRDAAVANLMAGLLVENNELFPDKCIVCDGKDKLPCLTCSQDGKCQACNGTGIGKDNIPCAACNASGKCPLCLGLGLIPCKICLLRNAELGKSIKTETKTAPSLTEKPKPEEPKPEEAPTKPEPENE